VIRGEVLSAGSFDPATTTRTFSVCLSDMGMIALLPRILEALRKRAPHATLRPVQVTFDELATTLQDGALDLAIGYFGKLGENLHQQSLFKRPLVGIVRGGKKRRKVVMSLDRFIQRKHVVASTIALTNQFLKGELRRHGAREIRQMLDQRLLKACSEYLSLMSRNSSAKGSRIASSGQFSLRGLSDVAAEWPLVALAWNIKRMSVLRGA
jgi:DNA-binding transcriptional LysR family regulator